MCWRCVGCCVGWWRRFGGCVGWWRLIDGSVGRGLNAALAGQRAADVDARKLAVVATAQDVEQAMLVKALCDSRALAAASAKRVEALEDQLRGARAKAAKVAGARRDKERRLSMSAGKKSGKTGKSSSRKRHKA